MCCPCGQRKWPCSNIASPKASAKQESGGVLARTGEKVGPLVHGHVCPTLSEQDRPQTEWGEEEEEEEEMGTLDQLHRPRQEKGPESPALLLLLLLNPSGLPWPLSWTLDSAASKVVLQAGAGSLLSHRKKRLSAWPWASPSLAGVLLGGEKTVPSVRRVELVA